MVENPKYQEISANAGYTVNLATPTDIEDVLESARELSAEDLKFYRTLAIQGAQ